MVSNCFYFRNSRVVRRIARIDSAVLRFLVTAAPSRERGPAPDLGSRPLVRGSTRVERRKKKVKFVLTSKSQISGISGIAVLHGCENPGIHVSDALGYLMMGVFPAR